MMDKNYIYMIYRWKARISNCYFVNPDDCKDFIYNYLNEMFEVPIRFTKREWKKDQDWIEIFVDYYFDWDKSKEEKTAIFEIRRIPQYKP